MKRAVSLSTIFTLVCGSGCSGLLPPALDRDDAHDLLALYDEAPSELASEPAESSATAAPPPAEGRPAPAGDATPLPAEPVRSNETPPPSPDAQGPWIPVVDENAPPPEPKTRAVAPDRHQRARAITFWTGIGAISLGGAALVAFGVTGRVTQFQLNRAYDEGATRDRVDTLQTRGDVMNGLALGGAALAFVGLGLSTIAYAIDYTRCGELGRRRRSDCHRLR